MTNIKFGKMVKLNLVDKSSNQITNRVGLSGSDSYHYSNIRIRNSFNSSILLNRNFQELNARIWKLESSVHSIDYVADQIFSALAQQSGFSLIRIADAEILTLAQNLVFPTSIDITKWGSLMAKLCGDPNLGEGDDEVRGWNNLLHMSGVNIPDTTAQDLLIQGISKASMVGLPVAYRPGRSLAHHKLIRGFQSVLLNIFTKLNISIDNIKLTDSAVNYFLYASGWFYRLMFIDKYPDLCQRYSLPTNYKPRILLVGRRAPEMEQLLSTAGCNIIAAIQPVNMINIWEAIDKIERYSFDIALVSAGIAAKYICPHISSHMHKIALDTGHLFDLICDKYSNLEYTNFSIPYEWIL